MYLIMKCVPLNDQYECDADREPITITDDWRKWYNDNEDFYCDFEVWELIDGHFKLIKEYGTPVEMGMVLAFVSDDEVEPIPLVRYKDATRADPIPKEVKELMHNAGKVKDWLISRGIIKIIFDSTKFIYTEYSDREISLG